MKRITGVAIAFLLLISAIALNEFVFKQNESSTVKAAQTVPVITEFKKGKHYTEVDSEIIKDALTELGIHEGQTFEIFSYSCPACFNVEPALSIIETQLSMDIVKMQLGFSRSPIAQVDYIMNKLLKGDELKLARIKLYQLMLSNSSTRDQKLQDLNGFLSSVGIQEAQIDQMTSEAESYSDRTLHLADLLELKSTPSLYVSGKYLVNMGEVGNVENLANLIKHLLIETKK